MDWTYYCTKVVGQACRASAVEYCRRLKADREVRRHRVSLNYPDEQRFRNHHHLVRKTREISSIIAFQPEFFSNLLKFLFL